jgi:hypothetical protein
LALTHIEEEGMTYRPVAHARGSMLATAASPYPRRKFGFGDFLTTVANKWAEGRQGKMKQEREDQVARGEQANELFQQDRQFAHELELEKLRGKRPTGGAGQTREDVFNDLYTVASRQTNEAAIPIPREKAYNIAVSQFNRDVAPVHRWAPYEEIKDPAPPPPPAPEPTWYERLGMATGRGFGEGVERIRGLRRTPENAVMPSVEAAQPMAGGVPMTRSPLPTVRPPALPRPAGGNVQYADKVAEWQKTGRFTPDEIKAWLMQRGENPATYGLR